MNGYEVDNYDVDNYEVDSYEWSTIIIYNAYVIYICGITLVLILHVPRSLLCTGVFCAAVDPCSATIGR